MGILRKTSKDGGGRANTPTFFPCSLGIHISKISNKSNISLRVFSLGIADLFSILVSCMWRPLVVGMNNSRWRKHNVTWLLCAKWKPRLIPDLALPEARRNLLPATYESAKSFLVCSTATVVTSQGLRWLSGLQVLTDGDGPRFYIRVSPGAVIVMPGTYSR